MSPVQKKRMFAVLSLIAGLALTLTCILFALSKNINLFYTPTQLMQNPQTQHLVRVGGMVVKGTVKKELDLTVTFMITDFQQTLNVQYKGILPDLFKEGQGVVVLGQMDKRGNFRAKEVLAKHDEKYMPPEITKQLAIGKTE